MSSCTDLINSDDELIIDTIENVDTNAEYSGENDEDKGNGGKGG